VLRGTSRHDTVVLARRRLVNAHGWSLEGG
jgi:hypothetical protein